MSARPGLCGGHRATGVPTAISQPQLMLNGENPGAGDELVVAHKPKAFTCSSVS
jgi:hypothetical protein